MKELSSGGIKALTTREAEVLGHLTKGDRNSDIARSMSIAPKTVEAHIKRILVKLGVRNRTEVVVYASWAGWIPDSPPAGSGAN